MSIYQQRIEQITRMLDEQSLLGMLLFPSPNMYYLTGFQSHPGERLFLVVIPAEGTPFFIAPQMFGAHIKGESWIEEIILWGDDDDPYEVLLNVLTEKGLTKGAFAVDDTMWAVQLLNMMNILPEAKFVQLGDLMSTLRLRKSADEIAKILDSGKIVDEIVGVIHQVAKPGMSEMEIVAIMEQEMKKRGASGPSFPTIVATGPNAALPHHSTGERRIQEGEFLLMDFGALYKGYCSDTTRTLCLGQPSEKMRQVHNIVREAQEIGVQIVRPGIKACEVDQAVRQYIANKGYGEYYTHRTGHGLGLEVHEEPFITGVSESILEAGMVFSIEPGIYIEGEFGVRIEDIVVVTDNGCQRVNNSPHELMIIDI